jgi:hypothetical protein
MLDQPLLSLSEDLIDIQYAPGQKRIRNHWYSVIMLVSNVLMAILNGHSSASSTPSLLPPALLN